MGCAIVPPIQPDDPAWQAELQRRALTRYHNLRGGGIPHKQAVILAREELRHKPLVGVAFACGDGVEQCCRCAYIAEALCDYPMGNGKTCDAPLCREHRRRMSDEDDIDFCPAHVVIAANRQDSPTGAPK